MKNIINAVTFCAVLFYSCSPNNTGQTSVKDSTAYSAPEGTAIKKAVDDAYAAISFKQGELPRYDSIKYAFIPQAQLINFITDTAQILYIDDFVKAYKNYIVSTKIHSFYEQELYGNTDQFQYCTANKHLQNLYKQC